MYYKNEASFGEMKKSLTNLSKDLKFASKDEVSESMKQLVMLPFMQAVSLNADVAFEVLNQYFSVEFKQYLTFVSLQDKFNQINQQLNMQYTQAISGLGFNQ